MDSNSIENKWVISLTSSFCHIFSVVFPHDQTSFRVPHIPKQLLSQHSVVSALEGLVRSSRPYRPLSRIASSIDTQVRWSLFEMVVCLIGRFGALCSKFRRPSFTFSFVRTFLGSFVHSIDSIYVILARRRRGLVAE